MSEVARACQSCTYWDPEVREDVPPTEGSCRRYAPAAALHPPGPIGTPLRAGWPLTHALDWCGEWQPRLAAPPPEEPLDEEQERWLRNVSAAQALLVLAPEQRDRLLGAVLTEEERQASSPPPDFHERVQRYFEERRARGEAES